MLRRYSKKIYKFVSSYAYNKIIFFDLKDKTEKAYLNRSQILQLAVHGRIEFSMNEIMETNLHRSLNFLYVMENILLIFLH